MSTLIKTPKDWDTLEAILLKARRRLSDEVGDDDTDVSPEEANLREFDPEEEGDDADKWLQENDPEKKKEDEDAEEPEEYSEFEPGEDEDAYRRNLGLDEDPATEDEAEGDEPAAEPEEPAEEQVDEPAAEAEAPGDEGGADDQAEGNPAQEQTQEEPAQEEVKGEGRFPQPTREDLGGMRDYTRPWEQKARDKAALEANPAANPVLYRQGKLLESGADVYKDKQDAFNSFKNSPEYKKANPIEKIKLNVQFKKDWHDKNPDYARQAMASHAAAHEEGKKAIEIHRAARDEANKHIMGGGAQAESPMSTEEAYQHAGGSKGEEGTTGSTVQDPASSFAANDKDFIEHWRKNYKDKAKAPQSLEDMSYDEDAKKDVQRILGDHPALKDPAKKAKVDAFFEKYHPLIGMSAKRVMNKLGLEPGKGDTDLGMLHEAGMHGIMHAINDYSHDHPSQASFATHAGHKIRGLQQTAMRAQDKITPDARAAQKSFNRNKDLMSLIGKHPPERADRMNRIDAAKQIKAPKVPEGGNDGQ